MLKPLVLVLTLAVSAVAQNANPPRGHWTGSLELPNRTMEVAFDLDQTAKGWVGSMSVPSQNANLPLADIRSEAGQVKFRVPAAPGAPSMSFKLSADGKSMEGDLTMQDRSLPLKLTLSGEPKVVLPKISPAVAKEFLGEWEGTLDWPGLRLLLKVSNQDGAAKATLVSVDQGGAELPVTSIETKDGKLTFDLSAVNGGYQGTLSKDATELAGQWTQNGNTLPLSLKKKAAPQKP